MHIIEHIEKIKSTTSLDELQQIYSIQDLIDIRKEVLVISNEITTKFNDELNKETIDKTLLSDLWKSKTNTEHLNELLFKAISAFEREQILEKTLSITEKLNSLVEQVDTDN